MFLIPLEHFFLLYVFCLFAVLIPRLYTNKKEKKCRPCGLDQPKARIDKRILVLWFILIRDGMISRWKSKSSLSCGQINFTLTKWIAVTYPTEWWSCMRSLLVELKKVPIQYDVCVIRLIKITCASSFMLTYVDRNNIPTLPRPFAKLYFFRLFTIGCRSCVWQGELLKMSAL